ncbi:MAG: hypothetical protein A2W84_08815 [Bacteroidetes bacterium GWC2_40_13]|jgi:hypothetical protein|nr:MAG: hypothetical protein A2W84_08815 [Bacteroidetes bacterium GWC2_40_13]
MERNKFWLVVFGVLIGIPVFCQNYSYGFLVEFTDKLGTEYSVEHPEVFLSNRALDRRIKNGIAVTEEDFPVNKSYADSICKFDAVLHVTSRWLNSAVFLTNNASFPDQLVQVSFVKKVSAVYLGASLKSSNLTSKWHEESSIEVPVTIDYGASENQLTMCNIQMLHNQGYMGDGIQMAVLDGGFYRADEFTAFESMFQNNRLLGTFDFVENDASVFEDHQHGMNVLSIIASNLPGQLVGSAPEASFWLLRSENVYSEYRIEEENFIAAAEFADSAGVDIITASLGYSVFDDDAMSYSYQDMDGKTTRVTQGAEKAFSKGIFMVNSAGNEGDNPWQHITAPSDGEHVLCVGAVDSMGNLAGFSSLGPSADGRTKPDVVGQGVQTSLVLPTGEIGQGSGTSFSGPLIAGMVACLWQALPGYSNQELLGLIRQTSSNYLTPDDYYGYGVPDFAKALSKAQNLHVDDYSKDQLLTVFPNPFYDYLELDAYFVEKQTLIVNLLDVKGSVVYSESWNCNNTAFKHLELKNLAGLERGVYILEVISNQTISSRKIVKNP